MNPPANTYSLQNTAKMLGIGQKKLFEKLRNDKVLDKNNMPYQRYIDQDIFKVSQGSFDHPVVGVRHYARAFVTYNGVNWLREHYCNEEAVA